MDFMNFVRDLFAASPAPAPADPAPTYGYGDSQVGYRPYGSDGLGADAQTVAGFAEGFGNDLLVAGSPSSAGPGWGGYGGWGAPAPTDRLGLDGGGAYGAPAPAAPGDGYAAYGNTDMGYMLQNVATVTTDATPPAPTFDAKLNWGWG